MSEAKRLGSREDVEQHFREVHFGNIIRAVESHAAVHGLSQEKVWKLVRRYIDEIVPFFNILAYYRFGYLSSRALLNMFYKVSAEHHPAWSGELRVRRGTKLRRRPRRGTRQGGGETRAQPRGRMCFRPRKRA